MFGENFKRTLEGQLYSFDVWNKLRISSLGNANDGWWDMDFKHRRRLWKFISERLGIKLDDWWDKDGY